LLAVKPGEKRRGIMNPIMLAVLLVSVCACVVFFALRTFYRKRRPKDGDENDQELLMLLEALAWVERICFVPIQRELANLKAGSLELRERPPDEDEPAVVKWGRLRDSGRNEILQFRLFNNGKALYQDVGKPPVNSKDWTYVCLTVLGEVSVLAPDSLEWNGLRRAVRKRLGKAILD
jgi:hypothetical protein